MILNTNYVYVYVQAVTFKLFYCRHCSGYYPYSLDNPNPRDPG